jgi:hypothetical protein
MNDYERGRSDGIGQAIGLANSYYGQARNGPEDSLSEASSWREYISTLEHMLNGEKLDDISEVSNLVRLRKDRT